VQPDVSRERQPLLRLVDPLPRPSRSTLRGRRSHPSSRIRIDGSLLYIGGDPESRIPFTRVARRWQSVNLVVAPDGRAGVQLATRRRPRLVVLDADLPDIDGADMTTHLRLRVLPHDTPIVVLAHDADPRVRARFVWAGAGAYIVKPLDVAELDRAVMALMEVAAQR